MASNPKKKLTPVRQEYKELAKRREPKRPVLVNCWRAFLAGGVICLIGQAVQTMFVAWAGFDKIKAGNPTVAVMILISIILTAIGVYGKITQWAGAGPAVPVTDFANSMSSAALEHRSEGIVLGVGGNMFKLAGPVIVFGTVAAFFVGIVYALFNLDAVGGGF